MQNILLKSVIYVLVVLLAGCSTPTNELPKSPVSDVYSAISFSDGRFKPLQGDSFAWYDAPVWADSMRDSSRQVLSLQLQNSVNDWLRSRGYRIVSADADYMIGLAIITEGGERSDEINAFFRLFPQLSESESGYNAGRILAGVIPGESLSSPRNGGVDSAELLWRAAIEAYILDLEPGSPESKARTAGLVRILLDSIP